MEISSGKSEAADCIIFRPRGMAVQRSVFCAFHSGNLCNLSVMLSSLLNRTFCFSPKICGEISFLHPFALALYKAKVPTPHSDKNF